MEQTPQPFISCQTAAAAVLFFLLGFSAVYLTKNISPVVELPSDPLNHAERTGDRARECY